MNLDFSGTSKARSSFMGTEDALPLQGLMARTGSFPLATAFNLLKRHTQPGDRVLDPFCGKGTTLLAARLLGCRAYGIDVAPEAVICSAAKLVHTTQFSVLEYIHDLRLSPHRIVSTGLERVIPFFHPQTLRQILQVRDALIHDLESPSSSRRGHALLTLAALLGILHGHATYSLSVSSAHAYSMAPTYVSRWATKNGLRPPVRDVKACLTAKLSKALSGPLPPIRSYRVVRADAVGVCKTLDAQKGKIDVVLTSPPYMNAQTYAKDNWLRHWLLGFGPEVLRPQYLQTGSIQRYSKEIQIVIKQIAEMLKPGGHFLCIAGPVKLRHRTSGPIQLDIAELISTLIEETALPCREKCIEEEQLEKQILDFLRGISLSGEELSRALAALEEERAKEHGTDSGIKASIEQALETCSRGKETLTNLRCRDLLTDEEFARQRAKLNIEEIALKERLASLETEDWIEPSRNLFLFSNRAVYWLAHGTIAEKRMILSTIGSNLTVKSKQLSIDANNPFYLLAKKSTFPTWCTTINDVRTFFRENPTMVIPLLAKPSA